MNRLKKIGIKNILINSIDLMIRNFKKIKELFKLHLSYKFIFLNSCFYKLISKIYYKIKINFWSGKSNLCSCCGRYLRKFNSYGFKMRKSAICPVCGSLERHRFLIIFLKTKTTFFLRNIKLLHFSPNNSLKNLFRNHNNIRYITTDLNSSNILIRNDITNLSFKNNIYDVIICSHVLEHIKNDNLALKELYRVLKTKGWGIIQIPLNRERKKTYENQKILKPKDRLIHFGREDHVRIYGLDFKQRVEKVGFHVRVIDYAKNLGPKNIKKFGLNANERFYFLKK